MHKKAWSPRLFALYESERVDLFPSIIGMSVFTMYVLFHPVIAMYVLFHPVIARSEATWQSLRRGELTHWIATALRASQ